MRHDSEGVANSAARTGQHESRIGEIERERGPGERCGGRKRDCCAQARRGKWGMREGIKKERWKGRKNGNATLEKGHTNMN
jgi:hypothetical protein